MKLRLAIPSTLAMTLICSCHGEGQHPTDAPALGDARVGDARVLDAATPLADAALPDAGIAIDAQVVADAAIDAIPDADLAG